MRLAVEVSTCSAERTGIGYYTEHFVDALIATRARGRRGRADQQRQAGAGAVRALARSPARRRRAGARDLDAARREPHARGGRRRLRAVPQLPGAAERRPVRSSNVVHDLAIIRMPQFFNLRQAGDPAPAAAARRARGRPRSATVSAASRTRHHRAARRPRAPRADAAGRAAPGLPRPATRRRSRACAARTACAGRYVVSVGTLEPRKNLPHPAAGLRSAARADRDRRRRSSIWSTIGGRGWRDRELRAELAARLASGRAAHARLRPGEGPGGALRRRGGAGLPVALRGLRPAGRRGDGLRHAGGRRRTCRRCAR